MIIGPKLIKCWTKVSSPCPWTIIPVNVTNNCTNPNTILFFTWNWSKAVLEWFILSWIKHKKSSLECTNSTLHVWYRCQRFLVNFMFLQSNFMFPHTRVVFSNFWYQILQGFSNDTLDKNKSSRSHIHIQIFFLPNQLIVSYEIFFSYNSLLIYKHEEKPNIKMINKNIKYLLQFQLRLCYYVDLMATKSKSSQDITKLWDFVKNQLVNNAWTRQY